MADSARNYVPILWKYLCSLLLWSLFGLPILSIVLILVTTRFILSKLVPLLYKNTSHILTHQSSVFGATKEEDECHVFSCFGMEGRIDLEDLRADFESRIIKRENQNGKVVWPEMQQRIVYRFGFPFWEWDRTFNIKNHVRVLDLGPTVLRSGITPGEVLKFIEETLLPRPFKRNQSPWELLVIPNFQDTPKYGNKLHRAKGTLLLFRFDHALGDGSAILTLFEELFKKEIQPWSLPVSKSLPWLPSFWNTINVCFSGLYEVLTIGFIASKFDWSPNKKMMRYNIALTPTIPLETIKKIRKATSSTFTAIMLSSVGNALYKFMSEAGYKVPESVSCTLPRRGNNHPIVKLTNHVAVAQTVIPTRQSPKQLQVVQASLDVQTQSRVPEMNFRFVQLFGCFPTTLMRRLISFIGLGGQMTFANIQFPGDEDEGKQKYKITSLFFLGRANTGGNGIVVNASGCKEGVRFLFQIDEGIIPKHQLHAEVFIKYFLRELEVMSKFSPNL